MFQIAMIEDEEHTRQEVERLISREFEKLKVQDITTEIYKTAEEFLEVKKRYDVDSITDTDLMRMQAVFQNENSLVFGFSIGGRKEEVIFLLKEAKKRGAKTVLFTANNRDDYKEFCTEVLLIPSLRHLNHGNVISPQFPILIMIDIIYSYYVEQDKTKKKILHDRTVQALEETYTEKSIRF